MNSFTNNIRIISDKNININIRPTTLSSTYNITNKISNNIPDILDNTDINIYNENYRRIESINLYKNIKNQFLNYY